MGNTKRPLFVNIFSSVMIIVFSVILSWAFVNIDIFKYFMEDILRVSDVGNTKVLMLALGYSLGTTLNAILLILLFQKDFKQFVLSISRTFWHSLSASIVMGFVAYQSLVFFGYLLDINTVAGIFLQGLFAGLIGIVAGIVVLALLKNNELKEIRKSLNMRIWKSGVIIPEKREL